MSDLAHPDSRPIQPGRAPDAPENYEKIAREAQARLEAAQAQQAKAKRDAEAALKRRADLLEAETPVWEALHVDGYSSTEILVVHDGFFVRSVLQKAIRYGEPPVSSSTMMFVPGPPPKVVPDNGAIVVTFSALKQGVDPARAKASDLIPSLRTRTATEILLRLPDGGVRVLKAPDLVEEPEPSEESDDE